MCLGENVGFSKNIARSNLTHLSNGIGQVKVSCIAETDSLQQADWLLLLSGAGMILRSAEHKLEQVC